MRERDIEACCDGSKKIGIFLISQRILRDEEEIIFLRGLLLVTAKMDDDKSEFKERKKKSFLQAGMQSE